MSDEEIWIAAVAGVFKGKKIAAEVHVSRCDIVDRYHNIIKSNGEDRATNEEQTGSNELSLACMLPVLSNTEDYTTHTQRPPILRTVFPERAILEVYLPFNSSKACQLCLRPRACRELENYPFWKPCPESSHSP